MGHSEDSVYSLIYAEFDPKAYVVLRHVRNATGFAARTRTADALVMSLWPSRGLTLTGFEIKVSRQDWKSELSQPEKAEEIARYCDEWYIAAPAGVVQAGELPPTWGLYEVRADKLVKASAPRQALTPQPVTKPFIGAMLRAATTGMCPSNVLDARVQAGVTELLEKRLQGALEKGVPELKTLRKEHEKLKEELGQLQRKVTQFETNSGISLGQVWESGYVGAAVKTYMRQYSDQKQLLIHRARELEGFCQTHQELAELTAKAAAQLRTAVSDSESKVHPSLRLEEVSQVLSVDIAE